MVYSGNQSAPGSGCYKLPSEGLHGHTVNMRYDASSDAGKIKAYGIEVTHSCTVANYGLSLARPMA